MDDWEQWEQEDTIWPWINDPSEEARDVWADYDRLNLNLHSFVNEEDCDEPA